LIASTIYITEDMVNGQTDFPSDDGTFAILHSAPGCSFKVDGDTSTQSLSSSTSAFANMRRSASSTISKYENYFFFYIAGMVLSTQICKKIISILCYSYALLVLTIASIVFFFRYFRIVSYSIAMLN